MAIEFKLPDVGEGVAEGEVVQWLVSEGDAVEEHQSVVEVMTDKATVEIPAPASGVITAFQAEAGDVVPVGGVLFILETEGAAAPAPAPAEVAVQAPAPAAKLPAPVAEVPAPAPVESVSGAVLTPTPPPPRAAGAKALATPSARRVARELGIDLVDVAGTGRNGVIRRADVEQTHASEASTAGVSTPAVSAPVSTGGETRVPFRGVRRKIAEAMVRSRDTAAHFTVVEEVDVTDLVALRARAKAVGAEQGVKVTYMPFIMKATAIALARFPQLNGHLDEQAGEIVQCHYVNLGIATDTDKGLMVPVIRGVESKGVLALAAELAALAESARTGTISPDAFKGSTFSITNAGNIGGILATPIINHPDIAILGVHRIMKRPGVVEGADGDRIEVRQYMNFSTSIDHRLADGADGVRFLVAIKQLLECPGLLAL
ncbi:MAG TPA: dihydrolipoamide acetyltransferase family protein [Planctomycetota bacterium]|nr:dihydrolipoamide acetyltransferase family protein [Planctomycetota bacterium]HJP02650.1 dihydrolipoamide acetyltransferase family protein [Planctomycetota bacterium]